MAKYVLPGEGPNYMVGLPKYRFPLTVGGTTGGVAPLRPLPTSPQTPLQQAAAKPPASSQADVTPRSLPCHRNITSMTIATWLDRFRAYEDLVTFAMQHLPNLHLADGLPLILHWGLESNMTDSPGARREDKVPVISGNASRSWGIGQVLDLNFPSLYEAAPPAIRRRMVPPPSMDRGAVQGADLTRAGTGESGVLYALVWADRAMAAYRRFRDGGFKKGEPATLARQMSGMSEPERRAYFMRMWGGASSEAGATRLAGTDHGARMRSCVMAASEKFPKGLLVMPERGDASC